MQIIDKEWERQKKIFHSNAFNYGREMSHTFGRIGVFKCCAIFIESAIKFHHKNENLEWLKKQRENLRYFKLIVEKNFVKGMGCKDKITGFCEDCLVHKYYLEITNVDLKK